MGYIEQFSEALIANSIADNYNDAISEWVFRGETFKQESSCICGHPIVQNMIVHNKVNQATLCIGNCCIKKFGIKRAHYNKSRLEYLRYAWTKAKTKPERKFIEGLAGRLKRYSKLRMTLKQKQWLEQIAGVPYRFGWRWGRL